MIDQIQIFRNNQCLCCWMCGSRSFDESSLRGLVTSDSAFSEGGALHKGAVNQRQILHDVFIVETLPVDWTPASFGGFMNELGSNVVKMLVVVIYLLT